MTNEIFESAVELLRITYEMEPWYLEIKIPHTRDAIIMYVSVQPSDLAMPASWKKIPLYIVHRGGKK